MIQKAALKCLYFSWDCSVSMEGSELWAGIRTSSFNAVLVKAPFMDKPLWNKRAEGPPYPEHGSIHSFPKYLHPSPEHKPACTDTWHRQLLALQIPPQFCLSFNQKFRGHKDYGKSSWFPLGKTLWFPLGKVLIATGCPNTKFKSAVQVLCQNMISTYDILCTI